MPIHDRRRGRHADIAALAPQGNAAPDVVDELVLLDTVLRPFRLDEELLALLPRLRDRHEVGADPPAGDDLVRDALVGKPEMAGRLVERRVDDWIFDNDLGYAIEILAGRGSGRQRILEKGRWEDAALPTPKNGGLYTSLRESKGPRPIRSNLCKGKAFPATGQRFPLEGNAIPVQGEACPIEGNAIPVQGEACPIEGNVIPA